MSKTAPEQLMIERVRKLQALADARSAELALDEQIAAAIARFEVRTKLSFERWASDLLTSDDEHPVGETTVHDWLARRNGRRPPACLVKLLCQEDDEFATWWCTSSGLETPKRRADVPDKELVRRFCELAPKRLGLAGEQLVREILTTPVERKPQEWDATTPRAVPR